MNADNCAPSMITKKMTQSSSSGRMLCVQIASLLSRIQFEVGNWRARDQKKWIIISELLSRICIKIYDKWTWTFVRTTKILQ